MKELGQQGIKTHGSLLLLLDPTGFPRKQVTRQIIVKIIVENSPFFDKFNLSGMFMPPLAFPLTLKTQAEIEIKLWGLKKTDQS